MLIITQENGIVCRILKLKLKILVLILTSFVEFCKKIVLEIWKKQKRADSTALSVTIFN